jgi:hypothetical protein
METGWVNLPRNDWSEEKWLLIGFNKSLERDVIRIDESKYVK